MKSRHARRQELRKAGELHMAPLVNAPQWGVWVSPTLWVSSYRGGPPHRWHRFWQRVLLGWRWEVKQG